MLTMHFVCECCGKESHYELHHGFVAPKFKDWDVCDYCLSSIRTEQIRALKEQMENAKYL